MNNEEKTGTVDELYGSVRDQYNYNERYYHQQAKETAAATAIAMLRITYLLSMLEYVLEIGMVSRFLTMQCVFYRQRLRPTKKPRL